MGHLLFAVLSERGCWRSPFQQGDWWRAQSFGALLFCYLYGIFLRDVSQGVLGRGVGSDTAQSRRIAQPLDQAFAHVPLIFDNGNGNAHVAMCKFYSSPKILISSSDKGMSGRSRHAAGKGSSTTMMVPLPT